MERGEVRDCKTSLKVANRMQTNTPSHQSQFIYITKMNRKNISKHRSYFKTSKQQWNAEEKNTNSQTYSIHFFFFLVLHVQAVTRNQRLAFDSKKKLPNSHFENVKWISSRLAKVHHSSVGWLNKYDFNGHCVWIRFLSISLIFWISNNSGILLPRFFSMRSECGEWVFFSLAEGQSLMGLQRPSSASKLEPRTQIFGHFSVLNMNFFVWSSIKSGDCLSFVDHFS